MKLSSQNEKEPPTHIKSESVAFLLVVWNSIAENFVVTYAILVYSATIAGVALNGVDNAVFAFFHDADMFRLSILQAGRTFVISIEKDNHTGQSLQAIAHGL